MDSEDAKTYYYELFNAIEKRNKDFVSIDELKLIFKKVGDNIPEKQIDLFFRLVDRDNNGLLDLEEFIDIIEGNVGKFETDSDLARLFELFDCQKTGFISLDGLEEIIRAFDNSLNEADLKEIAKRVDSDNDKRISINEFIKFMRG